MHHRTAIRRPVAPLGSSISRISGAFKGSKGMTQPHVQSELDLPASVFSLKRSGPQQLAEFDIYLHYGPTVWFINQFHESIIKNFTVFPWKESAIYSCLFCILYNNIEWLAALQWMSSICWVFSSWFVYLIFALQCFQKGKHHSFICGCFLKKRLRLCSESATFLVALNNTDSYSRVWGVTSIPDTLTDVRALPDKSLSLFTAGTSKIHGHRGLKFVIQLEGVEDDAFCVISLNLILCSLQACAWTLSN